MQFWFAKLNVEHQKTKVSRSITLFVQSDTEEDAYDEIEGYASGKLPNGFECQDITLMFQLETIGNVYSGYEKLAKDKIWVISDCFTLNS